MSQRGSPVAEGISGVFLKDAAEKWTISAADTHIFEAILQSWRMDFPTLL